MTGNSVEKRHFNVLNIKLQAKRRFKTAFCSQFLHIRETSENLRTGTKTLKLCI